MTLQDLLLKPGRSIEAYDVANGDEISGQAHEVLAQCAEGASRGGSIKGFSKSTRYTFVLSQSVSYGSYLARGLLNLNHGVSFCLIFTLT